MLPKKNSKEPEILTRKKRRKIIFIVLFVLLNIGVIIATAFSEFGNSQNAAKLSEVKISWWLLIPAVLCFFVAITIEISKYALMIRKMSSAKNFKENNGWRTARRTVLLGRYYDNVTPAAVGGQPFQIYYMRKNSGLPAGD